jgi:hypothetical protein
MDTERRKILDMLAKGTITADEAERLLDALQSRQGSAGSGWQASASRPTAKHLRIQIYPKPNHPRYKEPVNINVPIMIIKAGLKIPGLLSGENRDRMNAALKEHGIKVDLDRLDNNSIDELIVALTGTGIDVDNPTERVRIFCE